MNEGLGEKSRINHLVPTYQMRARSSHESNRPLPKPPTRSNSANSSPDLMWQKCENPTPTAARNEVQTTQELQRPRVNTYFNESETKEIEDEYKLDEVSEDSKPVGFMGLISNDNELVKNMKVPQPAPRQSPTPRDFSTMRLTEYGGQKSEISEEELKLRNEKRKRAMESAKHRQLDSSRNIETEIEESPSKEELIANDKYEKYCKHRKKVYEEIISTEQTYVNSLQVAVNQYILPLRKLVGTNEEILSKEHIDKLFSNIEVIFNVNSVLLNQLSESQSDWDVETSTISNIFLQIIPYLKLYFEYESDYDSASEKLLQALKNERFKKLDDENGEKYLNNLTLNSILIMPIQRIPRYNLLLKDLIKHTWNDHPDYLKLLNTLKEIQKVGSNLNETLRLNEKMIKVQKIADQFKYPELVQPHRYFIKKIKLKLMKVDRRKGKLKEKKAYLFNDLILISSLRRKSSYDIVLMDFLWIRDYLSMYITTIDDYENGNVIVLPNNDKSDPNSDPSLNDSTNSSNNNNNNNNNNGSNNSPTNTSAFYSVYEIWTPEICYRIFNDSMEEKNSMINQIIHSINQLMNIRHMLEDQRFELFERLRGRIYEIPPELLPSSNPPNSLIESLYSPEPLNETYPYFLLVGSQFEIVSFAVRSSLEDQTNTKILTKFFGNERVSLTSGSSYYTTRGSKSLRNKSKKKSVIDSASSTDSIDDENDKTEDKSKEVISFKVGVIKEGEMMKQGFNVKNWKKRWFVLEENILYYYRDNLAVKPKGSILLQHVHVYPSTHHNDNGFVIATKGTKGKEGRDYQMYAPTAIDRDEWITAISAQVKNIVEKWLLEGSLYKKTKSWKKWRSRYFALDSKNVHYFKDDQDTIPSDSMMLQGMKIFANEGEEDGRFVFVLARSDKKWYIGAASKEERERWVNEIKQSKRVASTISRTVF